LTPVKIRGEVGEWLVGGSVDPPPKLWNTFDGSEQSAAKLLKI